jgi:hypothetical protein
MRRLVCYREGRDKCHIGDTVEIPDDVDVYDRIYFLEVPEPEDDSDSKASAALLRKAKPDADTRKPEPDVGLVTGVTNRSDEEE